MWVLYGQALEEVPYEKQTPGNFGGLNLGDNRRFFDQRCGADYGRRSGTIGSA
jgi:hypothetical protein